MRRLVLPVIACFLATGCGLLANAVSDATTLKFDVPVLKPKVFTDNRVLPLSFPVQLSDSGQPATLPIDVATDIWGPVIRASLVDEQAGLPPIFGITVSDLTITADAPVPVHLALSSRNGTIWGGRAEPTDPASCSFSIDPAHPSEGEVGGRLQLCARDWIRANGVPDQLEMTVAAGGQLPAGSSGLGGAFNLGWSEALHTELETEMSCDRVTLDPAVSDNGSYLQLSQAQMSGYGYSSARVALGAFAQVEDGEGTLSATAELVQQILPGERYWIISAATKTPANLEDYRLAGNISPVLSPGMPDFPFTAVNALAGATGKGPGKALACWFVSGDAPRDGGIGLAIAGIGGLSGVHVEKAP